MTKEIMAIYRTFWSGMDHYNANRGGGGEGTFWKGMLFFSKPAGVQDFSPTLKTFFSASFAMQDSFLLNFGFAEFFSGFWTFLHICNGASLMSC